MGEFIVADRGGVRRMPLGKQTSVGRSVTNDLVLDAYFASRRHAHVWRQGSRFIIEDLGTTNGTYVNGQRLTWPRFLNNDDVVVMGDAQLTFVATHDLSDRQTPPRGMPHLRLGRVFCPQCGVPNHPEAGYCARCGHDLQLDAGPDRRRDRNKTEPGRPFTPTDPVIARPFPASRSGEARAQRRDTWLLILLLAIVAVLLMMIAGTLAIYVFA